MNLTKILLVAQCLLLILFGCSKSETEKLYKTTTSLLGVQMFSNTESLKEILKIPFKSKVEVVDKKKYYYKNDKSSEYSKIKYKGKIGYVLSSYLSDRDDVPFVDDVKYDYKLNEFDYDRDIIIKHTIKHLHKYWKDEIKYYYTENLQIFTFYGKDCDNLPVKRVVVIMVSKLTPNYNRGICYGLVDDRLVSPNPSFDFRHYMPIEKALEYAREPVCCGNECD